MIKNFLLKVDEVLFKKKLINLYVQVVVERRLVSYKSDLFNYGFNFSYAKNENAEINKLCDKYGTDKGSSKYVSKSYEWLSHNYADFYEILFRCRKKDIKLLIECGLGTNDINLSSSMGINGKPGASLRMWRDFFPNAKIIGVDIDKKILFEEERIETYYCNQLKAISIKNFSKKANLLENSADIIIDDGLHNFKAGVSFFENMIKFLNKDGIYVIEDITPKDMFLFKNYFSNLTDKFTVHFIEGKRPKKNTAGDNRLVLIFKNDV